MSPFGLNMNPLAFQMSFLIFVPPASVYTHNTTHNASVCFIVLSLRHTEIIKTGYKDSETNRFDSPKYLSPTAKYVRTQWWMSTQKKHLWEKVTFISVWMAAHKQGYTISVWKCNNVKYTLNSINSFTKIKKNIIGYSGYFWVFPQIPPPIIRVSDEI